MPQPKRSGRQGAQKSQKDPASDDNGSIEELSQAELRLWKKLNSRIQAAQAVQQEVEDAGA